jgi:hypothetical protein
MLVWNAWPVGALKQLQTRTQHVVLDHDNLRLAMKPSYIFLIIPRCPWTTCQVLRPQPSSLQTRYPTPPGDAELTRDPFAAQAYMRHSALFLLLFKQGVQQHSSRSRLLTDNFSLNQKRTIILDRYCHVGEFCASD